MTGRGRLFDNYAEAILREFAQQGALPTYGQLNSDEGFMAGSMAYLMGSRFLYWLEQKSVHAPMPITTSRTLMSSFTAPQLPKLALLV